MATIKIILWKNSSTKNGEHPIRLRVTQGNVKKYIGLDKYAKPNQWFEAAGRLHTKATKRELKDENVQVHEKCTEINDYLNTQEKKAKDIINEFEDNKIDWTLSQFENKFLHKATKGKVKPYIEKLIQSLNDTDHTGNAKCYTATLTMLHLFDKKFDDRVFSDMDLSYIKNFDIFLQKPRITTMKLKSGKTKTIQRAGCAGNTRKYYLKALRAVLNKAIEDKEASLTTYPFGKGGFEVAKLEEETDKRYLPTSYLSKIKTTKSEIWENEYARNLFLFSYFTYGMSFRDMAQLTNDNIKRLENGHYIVYKRQKTKNSKKAASIKIKLTNELKTIIANLCNIIKPVDNFLLPIVTIEGYSGKQLYEHIKGRLKKFNKYLIKLAEELKLEDTHLTSYVSRHTMAMSLQGQDVPREVISQILGHKDLNTTAIYLDSFDSNVIDEAAKLL